MTLFIIQVVGELLSLEHKNFLDFSFGRDT